MPKSAQALSAAWHCLALLQYALAFIETSQRMQARADRQHILAPSCLVKYNGQARNVQVKLGETKPPWRCTEACAREPGL